MEKVEYYTLKPSLKQYFGRKVNKALKFDEWTENKKVHQVLDNLELVTEIKDKRKMNIFVLGEIKTITTEETSVIRQKLVTGTILIWDEEQGYVIPPYQMVTIDEIEEDVKAMKEAYAEVKDDSKGNENKNI